MTPDTNPDPVKALLEACEPDEMRALKAFIENAPCACHPQVQCIRCTALENFRALSRAASVLRERGEPSAHQRCIDELVRGFNTAIGTLEASGNAFSAQNGRMNRDAALSLLNAADDGPHEAILSGPIGEDQSDLVKRLLLIASVIDTELPAVKSDALREAAAHISALQEQIERAREPSGKAMLAHAGPTIADAIAAAREEGAKEMRERIWDALHETMPPNRVMSLKCDDKIEDGAQIGWMTCNDTFLDIVRELPLLTTPQA